MENKRKRNDLTIEKKLLLIREVNLGEKTKSCIAKEFNVPLSTLSTIMKNESKIKEHHEKGGSLKGRKRMLGAKYDELEEKLLDWFNHSRSQNLPLSGPIMKEKADMLALKSGVDDFKCSNGWLQRFMQRHNLVFRSVCGESADVDNQKVEEWMEISKNTINQYSPRDIYNMDETGVFYNLLPDHTMAYRGEPCHGGKRSKERITVALCCNADGSDKMKPLVIGKFLKPRCFKGVTNFPCQYEANQNAWMTSKIFRDWLLRLDRKMAIRNRKILLLLDRCAAHSSESLKLENIQLVYLPANTTSILQPLDQGIINNLKKIYRKRLVQFLIRRLDAKKPLTKWNVLDAIRNICMAWDNIQPTVIQNCFKKLVPAVATNEETSVPELPNATEKCSPCGSFRPNMPVPSGSCATTSLPPWETSDSAEDGGEEWDILQNKLNFSKPFDSFVQVDDCLLTSPTPDDFEVMDCDTIDCGEVNTETIDSEEPPTLTLPKKTEALQALNILETVIQCSDTDTETIKAFDQLCGFVQSVFKNNEKQTKISSFFSPNSAQ
ncbi:tigger transposable element-derived protein 6-like [Bacillus rossius redtenbacheri]|uniref:tigger transposable element-derived protein 6-like n=1 Tax=Bacillus rossius redtenbacheri TaxID=93214 RepID=UPI002FDD19D9